MNCIKIGLENDDRCLEIGASRFWGIPDVFEGFQWPYYLESGDQYDLNFLCQINLEELSKYDKDRRLPKKGMLYFFYDLETMPDSTIEPNSCRVIYYDGSTSNLAPYEGDHDHTVVEEYAPLAMKFEAVDDDEEDVVDGEPHKILGYELLLLEDFIDEMIDDWIPLLQVKSFLGEDFEIEFGDTGILTFYIDEDDLEKENFSRVRTCIISE